MTSKSEWWLWNNFLKLNSSSFFTRSLPVRNRWTLRSCSTPQSAAPSAWGCCWGLHHHHHQLLCILLSSVANAPCSFPRLTVMHSKMKDFTPVPLLFNLSYSFKSVRNNNPQHQGLWSSGFSAFSGPIKCLYHSLLSAKIQLAGSFYLLHAGCCEDAEPDLWGLEF